MAAFKKTASVLILALLIMSLAPAFEAAARDKSPEVYWKFTGWTLDKARKKFAVKGQIINNSDRPVIRLDNRTLTIIYSVVDDSSYIERLVHDDQKMVASLTKSVKVHIAPGDLEEWTIGSLTLPEQVTKFDIYEMRIKKATFKMNYKLGPPPPVHPHRRDRHRYND